METEHGRNTSFKGCTLGSSPVLTESLKEFLGRDRVGWVASDRSPYFVLFLRGSDPVQNLFHFLRDRTPVPYLITDVS